MSKKNNVKSITMGLFYMLRYKWMNEWILYYFLFQTVYQTKILLIIWKSKRLIKQFIFIWLSSLNFSMHIC